jgi:DnaJ-class molecular chaperone
MQSAYEKLGLSSIASEAEIRNRYLQLVREYPPDRAPERFAEIRAAFDELRNPAAQMERRLFRLSTEDSLADLEKELLARLKKVKLSTAAILSLAETS